MRTEIDQIWTQISKAAQDFEEASFEIAEILRDSDSPKGYALVKKLNPFFENRVRAMGELIVGESKLQGLAPHGFDFGYSHENNHSIEFGYMPINSDGASWYPSIQEAIMAKLNDLRFTIPTFLIFRPTPNLPQRLSSSEATDAHEGRWLRP